MTTTRDGTLLTIDGRPTLRFERRYPHPVERVWTAVSDADEMAQWFPGAVIGERSVGAELVFDDRAQQAAAREAGEPTRADGPLFRGEVVVYDPPQVFSFTWGTELLRIELTPDGDETVLVFTHQLYHRSTAARTGGGWHACLSALDKMLGVLVPEGETDWTRTYDHYVDLLGPPLGSRGPDGSMTWEGATHQGPERVRAAVDDPAERDAWGGGKHTGEPLRWEVEPSDHGAVFRLTHETAGDDAELAATWHALLLQLDMYLAAGLIVPLDPDRWVDGYRKLLSE
jgi:uncharacterized protein YndB with AHSA1/START domain